MLRRPFAVLLTLVALTLVPTARAAEYPLAKSKIRVAWAVAGEQSLKVSGRWQGSLAGNPPTLAGATLRVSGGFGEGGTTVVTLAAAAWTPLPNDRGYKYSDPTGAAGGIRTIVLKNGRKARFRRSAHLRRLLDGVGRGRVSDRDRFLSRVDRL